MSHHTLQVNDIEVRYRWDGPPGAPVVMMAHAMGTDLAIWDAQVPALADRYRLLRYDWRGHGGSGAPPGPYSLAVFVDDACALMDALALEKVHWVGLSTGGMIGQGVGIHHPDRIASLSLCNTMARAEAWYRDWVHERHRVVREGGMSAVWEITKRMWFSDPYVDTPGPHYEAVREAFCRTSVQGYVAGTSAVADLDYLDALARIEAPTLVMAAADDPVTPPARTGAIHAAIAGARLVMLSGQRHFSNVEVPQRFNPHLRRFLDEVSNA